MGYEVLQHFLTFSFDEDECTQNSVKVRKVIKIALYIQDGDVRLINIFTFSFAAAAAVRALG